MREKAPTSTENDTLLECTSPCCWFCSPEFTSSLDKLSLLRLHTHTDGPTGEWHCSAECDRAVCEKLKKTECIIWLQKILIEMSVCYISPTPKNCNIQQNLITNSVFTCSLKHFPHQCMDNYHWFLQTNTPNLHQIATYNKEKSSFQNTFWTHSHLLSLGGACSCL
jgi:hypothetical protein